jgi:hypothetical protein
LIDSLNPPERISWRVVIKAGEERPGVGCRAAKQTNEVLTDDDMHVGELIEILQILERIPEKHRQRIIGALALLLPHELDLPHPSDQ